jgi:predicted permease
VPCFFSGDYSGSRLATTIYVLLDLRYAFRIIGRSPGFTAAILLLFTAGIGASTAVFSVLHGVVLRSLPYEDSEKLVRVRLTSPSGIRGPISVLDYLDLAAGMRSATLAAYQGWLLHIRSDSGKQSVHAARVTASFFDVLKARPALGRVFTHEEDKPGGPPVVLVSHRFWTQRLGANPQAIGRIVGFDEGALNVIGVMPAGFEFRSRDVDVWLPIRLGDATHRMQRSENYLTVIGRLKGTLEAAQREGAAVTAELARLYPATNSGLNALVENLRETITGGVRKPLMLLFAGVTLVLLIACANGGHLMLARAASRAHDFAVRRALGATTWRIVRHQLALSLLLSAVAAALSLLVAVWLIDALRPLLPDALPRRHEITISASVLLFAVIAALVTSGLAAAAPAARASSLISSSRVTARWSRFPLAAQMAFSFVLLAGAGALLHSLYDVLSADPGFRRENVITVSVAMPASASGPTAHLQDLLRRIQQTPGVTATGAVNYPPLASEWSTTRFLVHGKIPASPDKVPVARYRVATPEYFRAVGATLLAGRTFEADEGSREAPVFVINEAMARLYWPGQNPVGDAMRTGGLETQRPWGAVIGVVADMRQSELDRPVEPEIFQSHRQFPWPEMHLVVRTAGDGAAVWPSVRAEILAMDRNYTLGEVRTLDELIDSSVRVRRFYTWLLAAFAAIGALLVAVGIHASLAFSIAQRTREIGIRFALGAGRAAIIRMLAGSLALPVAGALVAGIAASAIGMRLMASLIYGELSLTPFTAAAAITLALVCLASVQPALRAIRVSPSDALRLE